MADDKKETTEETTEEPLGTKEILESLHTQGDVLKALAEQAIPSNTKNILEKLNNEFVSPYLEVEDKIAILEVSTADLAYCDGWPGYIERDIPGQFTPQGLQIRARYPLAIHYVPDMNTRHSLTILSKENWAKIQKPQSVGIPNQSMLAALTLRAGDSE
jgi:hypothetical protein